MVRRLVARLAGLVLRRSGGSLQGWSVDGLLAALALVDRVFRGRPFVGRLLIEVRTTEHGSTRSGVLAPSGPSVAASPIGESAAVVSPVHADDFEAVLWREYRDVLLPVGDRSRRTAWIADRALVIERTERDVFSFEKYAMHLGALAHSRSRALLRHATTADVPIAVYPGSFSPGNWYHWLLETLPRIWLMERLPEEVGSAPVLIHPAFVAVPTVRESLALFRGPRDLLIPTGEDVLRIKRMVWTDGLFTLKHHAVYPGGRVDHASAFHPAMRDYRAALLERIPMQLAATPRRVFLDRGNRSRIYNHQAVGAALAELGFVAIDPSGLDLSAQASLFSGAEVLVGPTGGAWSGLIFCSAGTRALYWTPRQFASGQVWSSVAALSGVETHEYLYDQPAGGFQTLPYSLDVPALMRRLEGLLS